MTVDLDVVTLCLVQAMEAHKTAKMARCYFSWQDMLNNYPAGQVPYTPIIPVLHGLRASLDLMSAEGFDNVIKRHNRSVVKWQSEPLHVLPAEMFLESHDLFG